MTIGQLIAAVVLASLTAACTAANSNAGLAEIVQPTFSENPEYSLLTARVAAQRVIGAPACPEDHICMNVLFEDTLDVFETQLGPTIRDSEVRSLRHGAFVAGSRVAYLVKRDDSGELWALEVRIVRDNRACFGSWIGAEWPELAKHRRTSLSDGELCFRVD